MAQHGRKTGEKTRGPDSTLSINVKEPQLDSLPFSSPPLRLYTLRQHLESFTLLQSNDPAGFNFQNFARNIRGIKRVEHEGQGFDILFTRSAAFLTFYGIPGLLRAISHIIGGEAAGRVNVAAGKNGEMLTICRITAKELNALLHASSKAPSGAFMADSILPADASADVDPAEFGARLARCRIISCDGQFDLAGFARRINVVSVFRDEHDAGYFVLGMKDDESVYTLYVNTYAPPVGEENPIVARLKYGNDSLTLFKVDVIG